MRLTPHSGLLPAARDKNKAEDFFTSGLAGGLAGGVLATTDFAGAGFAVAGFGGCFAVGLVTALAAGFSGLFGLGAGLAALGMGFFVDLALFLAMKYTSVAPEGEKWGDGKKISELAAFAQNADSSQACCKEIAAPL